MGQGGFGGQYETGVSSKRSPDERSDIQGWTPHIAEPVITVRAQLRSSRARIRATVGSCGLPADYAAVALKGMLPTIAKSWIALRSMPPQCSRRSRRINQPSRAHSTSFQYESFRTTLPSRKL
jgi:hypothetical protein